MTDDATGPVFIGGLAFSGKTPLRIALSAHPRLALTRRTAMWPRFHGRFGDLARSENLERCLSHMLADPAIAALEPEPTDIRRRFAAGPATYARLFAAIHQQHAERVGKPRWGDQMGMFERHADLVLSSYPDARMIHMIRDPRARYRAGGGVHRQLPGKLGWETARWRHSAALALRNRSRFPDRYRILQYEQFRREPEPTLREVCAFIGEDYDPAMAQALQATTAAGGTTRDESSTTPGGAPGRDADAVSAFVERYARSELRAHDYDVAGGSRQRALPASFYLLDLPCNRVGFAVWQIARSTRHPALEAV